MSPPREPPAAGDTRPTDYGDDVARTELSAAATTYHPATGARLRRVAGRILLVLLAAFVLVRGLRSWQEHRLAGAAAARGGAAPLVEAVSARRVAGAHTLTLPGQTAAWFTSTIYARVNGYVGHWYVDIGDQVRQGQLLALLETPELDAELAAAHAQLGRARADVAMRQAQLEFARTQYQRWRDSPRGVVSEQEREQKHAEYDSAAAEYQAARAQVALDEARLVQYRALSAFKRVTAPFAGVITARDIDVGNLVTAGSTSATTPLYVMTQNDPMRVYVDVPQSAAADLLRGSVPVTVSGADGLTRSYPGRVARTSGALDARARTLRVEVDLDNRDGALLPGLYVRVALALPPRGLVQVPAAALLFRSSGPQVAVIAADGRVALRSVSIARDDGSEVELAAGVAPGEELALNLSSEVRDGQRVRVGRAAAAVAQAGAP